MPRAALSAHVKRVSGQEPAPTREPGEFAGERRGGGRPVSAAPPVWTTAQLQAGAAASREAFRAERIDEPLEQYLAFYETDRAAVETLLELTVDLERLQELAADVLGDEELFHAARYLASPPISEDDLRTLADTSVARSRMRREPGTARQVIDTILLALDRERFPWVSEARPPTPAEREAAVLASAAMRAFRQVETQRRNQGKQTQEDAVKAFLVAECGFEEVPARAIANLTQAPAPGQFSGEALVGTRKADIPVRLWDGRLMPIECKVSNSSTNSYKRINNDAAAKAETWLGELGSVNCVPTAVMSGVFAIANLQYAQDKGLTLFWAHDLGEMKTFIEATRP